MIIFNFGFSQTNLTISSAGIMRVKFIQNLEEKKNNIFPNSY